jgi:ABC-2 type transport system permease protein
MKTNWREHLERTLGMVGKEFRQIFRDPRMVRVIFLAPILQLILFGYAVSTDIWKTRTMVVDHDRTQASRSLVDALTASGYFTVVEYADRSSDLTAALDSGDVVIGLEIPAGFATDFADRSASIQLLLDGTNSNTASVAMSYAERIILDFGRDSLPGSIPQVVELRERAWYNADLGSRNYNVPAVIGALMLLVSLQLTSLAVVREREIGTLEQLRVSPLAPSELIAGKTIPFGLIGLLDMGVVTTLALVWFGIPFRGSILLLLGASVLYLLSGLGVGLLISTVSKTQQEAFMVSFLVFMPAILLSGFMFPVSSMPAVFRWLTLLNPMRHYIEIVRNIFLKGTGLLVLWPQFLGLFLLGAGLLWFSSTRFSKTTA